MAKSVHGAVSKSLTKLSRSENAGGARFVRTAVQRDAPRAQIWPTDLHYRLSQRDGHWVMEGRQANAAWTSISCEAVCQYRPSTAADIEALFPLRWREQADLACIQNHAQAFCRYSPKGNATAANHVIVALVTGRPVPIFLRRVS